MDENNNKDFNDTPYVGEQVLNGEVTTRKFNAIIGGCLLWGFLFNYLIVMTVDPTPFIEHSILLLIGYFICCIMGSIIYTKSDNPLISFIGYNLLVLPVGFVLNTILWTYTGSVISEAVLITGIVTLVMMSLSVAFPNVFMKIGRTLGIVLLITIVGEIISLICGYHGLLFDWIVALIFCGYIGVDWARANNGPRTADAAVDAAAGIYMDIINLFLRLLSILARSDRR